MTDIVERLRPIPHGSQCRIENCVRCEAAAEIGRLLGLLRDIDAIGVEFGPKIQSRIDAELAADRDGAATSERPKCPHANAIVQDTLPPVYFCLDCGTEWEGH